MSLKVFLDMLVFSYKYSKRYIPQSNTFVVICWIKLGLESCKILAKTRIGSEYNENFEMEIRYCSNATSHS